MIEAMIIFIEIFKKIFYVRFKKEHKYSTNECKIQYSKFNAEFYTYVL